MLVTFMVTGQKKTELLLREALCCITLSTQQKWSHPPASPPLAVRDPLSFRLSTPISFPFPGSVTTVFLARLASGCQ